MNRRDIVVGIVVVILLVLLFNRLGQEPREPVISDEKVAGTSVEEDIEEALGRQIPDTGEKVEMSSVEGKAVATRDTSTGGYRLSVLADLPETDKTYQVWLSDAADPAELVSVGTLSQVKGGYLLETNAGVSSETYKKVIISQEDIVDATLEDQVLSGSF